MKVRQGFVTNSSSSSFVVLFDSIPTSVQEVHKMLFPNDKNFKGQINFYDKIASCASVASRVWQDMQGQIPNDLSKIRDAYGGNFPGAPKEADFYMVDDGGPNKWPFVSENFDRIRDLKFAEHLKKRLIAGKFIFCFSYADESGEALLEHGNIFEALVHDTINKH